MRTEGFSWVQNGSTADFLLVMGALLGLYLAAMAVLVGRETWRPEYRAARRKAARPGAIVRCGCPNRTASPLFGDQTYVTRNALETERYVGLLQARGCGRVLVIGQDGAESVAMPAGPVTECGQSWKEIGR